MNRDTYEKLSMHPRRDRGRFGDNEYSAPRANEQYKSDLVDVVLILRTDKRPHSLAVNDPAKADAPWIFLPKAEIEYETRAGGSVKVTMPEWLAKEKGLL